MSEAHRRFDGDYEVLSALVEWSARGQVGALVTVLHTWGSSPRPPGSLLAIRKADGCQVGSVSGGCVEQDLVQRYCGNELAELPACIDYGVDPDGAARHGLPCGGRLELLVEEPEGEALTPLLRAIERGALLQRRLCLDTHEVSLHPVSRSVAFEVDSHNVRKVFGPGWHLLLVGAGQLADYLARIAITLGFRITLCDPRPEIVADEQGLPLARRMPDDLIAEMDSIERTAVITLAHDPKLDDMALMAALQRDFFYIGALGSKRSAQARCERLLQLDITEAQLARLHAPVGIDIGSHAPAEIAVAVAADLIATRQGVEPRR